MREESITIHNGCADDVNPFVIHAFLFSFSPFFLLKLIFLNLNKGLKLIFKCSKLLIKKQKVLNFI